MKKARLIRKIISIILAFSILVPMAPIARAKNNWNMEYFYKTYSDPHFNLKNEPDRVMTVEEFIAIIYAYSYYGSGASNITVKDKYGRAPSAWCAKYVQAEANKKTFDPGRIAWNEPVTVAFAAQFMARSKGKYSYDSNNLYSFTGTQNLSTDDILYLSVAVDHGLIPYKSGMNVSATIKRRNARDYEIPTNMVYAKAPIKGNDNTMRECHAYFIDCYWELDASELQYRRLKRNSNHITMVTFQSSYLNGTSAVEGNKFLRCDIVHKQAVASNPDYEQDPQLDAIEYCKENGITALLGVSNARNDGFSGESMEEILSTYPNMQTAVSEILVAVNKYDLDGVNLGIEISDPEYAHLRNNYSTFIQLLGNALHNRGKVLMVTAGSYFTDAQERASIYDYSVIGDAADYVHIILYDDYNDTGFASRGTYGPMSNYLRIGRCLRYASTKMDRSKILFGMGAYAVDFNLTWWSAQDVNYSEAKRIMSNAGAVPVYDNTNNAAGAYFEYKDASGCRHRVYYETFDTAYQRTAFVNNYNLAGYSVFNLNDENTGIYNAITGSSNFKAEVVSAMREGLVPYSIRGNYDRPILRHEFCSVIVALIESKSGKSIDRFLASKGKSLNYSAFNDTKLKDVLAVNALGIVGGYGDGSFAPNKTISRQEAAAILMRLAKVLGMSSPNGASITFNEISSMQPWARQGVDFISACVDKKSGKPVMGGTGNNNFSPNGTYTREQTYMSILRLFNAL